MPRLFYHATGVGSTWHYRPQMYKLHLGGSTMLWVWVSNGIIAHTAVQVTPRWFYHAMGVDSTWHYRPQMYKLHLGFFTVLLVWVSLGNIAHRCTQFPLSSYAFQILGLNRCMKHILLPCGAYGLP